MPRKKYKKKIACTLKFSEIYNDKGKFVGGGMRNPTSHIDNEMWVEIMDDPVLSRETDQWGVTGRQQMHIAGTRKAYEELGILFLAMANYDPPEPGYSVSIELSDRENQPAVHFVVHLPVEDINTRPKYAKIHNIATGIIDEDGNITDTTLLAKEE